MTTCIAVCRKVGFWLGVVSVVVSSLEARAASHTPPPVGVAPVVSPVGGFGIEGDLLANLPVPNVGDWTSSGSGGVLDQAGAPLNASTTFHFVDPYGNAGSDFVFAGGNKWFDNPNTWAWTTGKSSSKTDINNVLLHVTTDVDGHVWAVVSADRLSTSGDSYIDFEFLQSALIRNGNGTFASAGPHGGRTTNDVLLSLAFTGGGSTADFFAWRWQPDGGGGFSYVDVTASLPAGRVFVALNGAATAVPYGAFGQTNYPANAFAEAAVDLTVLLSAFDACTSFGFETIMVKTKASQSETATIEDFIDPIQYTLRIGPGADAGADQTRCTEGDSTAFSLNGAASAGLFPIASTTWSVVAGTATIESSNSLLTTAHVLSASATLRLTVVQSNGCTETDDVVLTVAPLPPCSIEGPSGSCPGSTLEFRAPPGMTTYSWSIAGNGSVSGATNAQTVTVNAGSVCGETFTLLLNVISNNCPALCTVEVVVNDTNPPTLACPADLVLECPADTRTNATGVATAQDDCGPVTVSYSDLSDSRCGGTLVITRTWTAIDQCGNSTSCVQTITARDTTAPLLACPPDVVVECPGSTDPGVTGAATATDACGTAHVSYSDAITPGDNCAADHIVRTIRRTWTATDDCGNSSSCVQTITVRDTTAPLIVCPQEVVVECPGSTDPDATGTATSTEACGTARITYSDAVVQGANCAVDHIVRTIRRTWTASDDCGNSSSCVQTITVRDTTAPLIVCPQDVIVECPGSTDPGATGTATASEACGSAQITYSDAISPGANCALDHIVRTIRRTWRATDDCGNSSSCVQTITVKDTTAPLITCPVNVVLECPSSTQPGVTGTAMGEDRCSAVTIQYTDAVNSTCGGARVIARTWTATDECGNRSSCVQTITLRDTIAPIIVCPPDLVLECSADTRPNATGVATAEDACSSVSVSYSDAVTPACGGSKTIARTWTATDPCGNSASCLQTITVLDRTPPNIACKLVNTYSQGGYGGGGEPAAILEANYVTVFPNGLTIGVFNPDNGNAAPNGLFWEPNAAGLSALRICVSQGGTSSGPFTRDAINPTDNFGGGGLARQTITLTLNVAFNTAGVLGAGPNNFSSLVYTKSGDSLSGLTVSEILDVANRALAGLGLPAGHDFSSLAGLIGSLNISFHDYDISSWAAGYLSTPMLVVQCASEVPPPNPDHVEASDSCSGPPILTNLPDIISDQTCANRYVITRTWVARDACGNTNSCSYNILVNDTTPPALVCGPDRSVAPGVAWDFDEPVAADNCGSVTLQVIGTVTNLIAQTTWVVTRTWEASDECGNISTCQQTITVASTAPPLLQIELLDSGKVRLSWPASAIGFQLESCGAFSSSVWAPMAATPFVINAMNTVEFMPTSSQCFYRLNKSSP